MKPASRKLQLVRYFLRYLRHHIDEGGRRVR